MIFVDAKHDDFALQKLRLRREAKPCINLCLLFRIKRILPANTEDAVGEIGDLVVEIIGNALTDDRSDHGEIGRLKTAGSCGGGTESYAAGHEGRARLKRDCIFIRGNVHLVQNVLRLFAGDILARQVDKH